MMGLRMLPSAITCKYTLVLRQQLEYLMLISPLVSIHNV